MSCLELLSAVTATNGKPTLGTDGVAVRRTAQANGSQGFYDYTPEAIILLWSDAGSGTMDVTIRLWGYLRSFTRSGSKIAVGKWFPLGVGADSTKGTINAGGAAGETDTNAITHTEVLRNFLAFDRLYAEVVTINGTSTRVNLLLRDGRGS